jgi:hypothetical protein
MAHVISDKTLKTLSLKIDKHCAEREGQEKLDKKYEDFYFYRNYKNEEVV